jgi:hypothetical protein
MGLINPTPSQLKPPGQGYIPTFLEGGICVGWVQSLAGSPLRWILQGLWAAEDNLPVLVHVLLL